jgi:DNA-binding CsgD family transcriptional regulator
LLGLKSETVRTHKENLMAKLKLHSAHDLQAYALRKGFVTISDL